MKLDGEGGISQIAFANVLDPIRVKSTQNPPEPLSTARRLVTRISRPIPAGVKSPIALELSVRSLVRARRRCNTVADFTHLTRTWLGFGDFSYIRPGQRPDEQTEFFELVKKRAPRRALEIGTCHGGTLFHLMAVGPPDLHAISVDLPGGVFGGGYKETREAFYLRAFPSVGQRLDLIRARSQDPATVQRVRALVGPEGFDLLFIDGDHRYGPARSDFELYAPIVRKHGLIAFHDIAPNPGDNRVDVPRLWAEIRGISPSIEVCKPGRPGSGLGIFHDWDPAALGKAWR